MRLKLRASCPLQGDWQPSGVMTVSEAAPSTPPGAFANMSPYSGVSRTSGSPFRGAPTHSPLQEHVSRMFHTSAQQAAGYCPLAVSG